MLFSHLSDVVFGWSWLGMKLAGQKKGEKWERKLYGEMNIKDAATQNRVHTARRNSLFATINII